MFYSLTYFYTNYLHSSSKETYKINIIAFTFIYSFFFFIRKTRHRNTQEVASVHVQPVSGRAEVRTLTNSSEPCVLPKGRCFANCKICYKWKLKILKITDIRNSIKKTSCLKCNALKPLIMVISQRNALFLIPSIPGISVLPKEFIWRGKEADE